MGEGVLSYLVPREPLGAHAQVAATLITAFGLWWLYKQVKAAGLQVQEARLQVEETRRQSLIETLGQLVSLMTEINKVFIDRPHLRPYFYEQRETDGVTSHHAEAVPVAEMLLDVFDHVLTHVSRMPEIWGDHQEAWERWIASMFEASPLLCEYYLKKWDWYTKEMSDVYAKGTGRTGPWRDDA